jgi:hypothetical protein
VADWTIEPFGKQHDRAAFTCGRQPLDDFIRARVSQYEKRRLGKTFVAVPQGGARVIGYYTLAAGAVLFERLPPDAARKLPRHPVPVVLLARLDALQRSLDLSAGLGVHAVEVDALDDAAAAFYRKYGFLPLLDDPLHLYLPMTTIEKVLA